ncbi:MAG TPA: PilN domain-containing protein [Steroidobacteraceae bacterium]
MPRINLLPWREEQRKQRRQEFVVGILAALVFAGLLALATRWQMNSMIEAQNRRNDYLKAEIAELDKQIAEILDLEQRRDRLKSRIQVIEQLERSRPEIVHVFDQLVKTLPDGVYLTGVKQTNRRLTLKGVAQSSTRVASYMRNIDASEWLAEPSLDILETKGSADGGAEFTLQAVQENPQLPSNSDEQVAAR